MAEYQALILELEMTVDIKLLNLQVFGDSQLVINQLLNIYEVRKPELIPYCDYAKRLKGWFDVITLEHVPRGQNQQANALASLASTIIFPGRDVKIEVRRPHFDPSGGPSAGPVGTFYRLRKLGPSHASLVMVWLKGICLAKLVVLFCTAHWVFLRMFVLECEEGESQNCTFLGIWAVELDSFRAALTISKAAQLKDKKSSIDVKRWAPRFINYKDALYKASFEGIWLRCLGSEEAVAAMEEAHSGMRGTHQ
ncbi:uncharacterized protein [Rutidosis leptorrhynchoides]|uniref:uncharacterized protein n=1 Tax=Rutidosis leptorrhynchoides TaxID=125765 RepID=UPI003A9A28F5